MRIFTAVLVISVLSFPNWSTADASAFTDVPQDHPNRIAIEYAQANGIVSGYAGGDFQPESVINRAEFTKIIIGTQFSSTVIDVCISENIPQTSTIVFFPDVPKNSWFAKYICAAKVNNIIDGYPNGNFTPSDPINFVEAAKVISNAFGYAAESDPVWYKPFVDELANRHAIPVTIGSFDALINRGEMAEMIYRLKANVITKPSLNYEEIRQLDPSTRTITLQVFFPTLRENANMMDCGKVDMVSRTIPYTTATARAALDQLFLGPTDEEKVMGMLDHQVTSQSAHLLKRVFIQNGTAYLDWKLGIMQVAGGAGGTSCGGSAFGSAIDSTLLQFPSVTRVIQAIEGEPSEFYSWNQRGCDYENDDWCDDAPYKNSLLPTTCTDEPEGMPVITSISRDSGPIGTELELKGCNFAGFEGDKNVWMISQEGGKAILFPDSGSTSKRLLITLKTPLCKTDTSYSGDSCSSFLDIDPGVYQLQVMPWGRLSNTAEFVVR